MTQLHTVSSMRAALNSKYCMRAQLKACNLDNGQDGYQTGQYHSVRPSPEPTGSGTVTRQANKQSDSEYFSYQEGQHRVVSNGKLHLPEEIKITKTPHGKRWATSSMEIELARDILEVRDGLGKVVDAMVYKSKT